MMPSLLLLLATLGSAIAWPVGNLLTRRSRGWMLALLPAGLFLAVLASTPVIAAGGAVAERIPWVPSLDVALAFRLDGFSFLFALLITGIGALVVVYADAYLSEHPPRARARFHTLILCFMTAMLGAVLADDLVVLFLFWEATSFLSFLLIGFDVDSPSARRSALMSLRVTAGGGLALLVAVLLIGMVLGSYSLSGAVSRAGELAASPWSGAILAGLFIGAFTKSAQFPFHFWLPNAMQAPITGSKRASR